jgi:hypothetical protein
VPYTLQLTKTSSCSSIATSALQSAAQPRGSTLQSRELSSSAPSSRDSSPYSRNGVLETNKNKFLGFLSVCFVNPQQKISFCYGLIRCFEPISKQPKQTELFRNKPKSETNRKNPNFFENTQIYSLLNCLGGSSVCLGSIETSKLSVLV